MRQIKPYKSVLVTGWVLAALVFALSGFFAAENAQSAATPQVNPDDYMGNDSCKACHEQEHTNFLGTPHDNAAHSRFETDMSRGCESCHGPAKAHVLCESKKKEARDLGQEEPVCESGLSGPFRGKSPKDVSDNCLKCHAGMGEEHINYRRGEHWRNDVGCTDCHASTPQRAVRTATGRTASSRTRTPARRSAPPTCRRRAPRATRRFAPTTRRVATSLPYSAARRVRQCA
jgi:hypothetical protein